MRIRSGMRGHSLSRLQIRPWQITTHRRVYPYYLAPLIRLFARPERNLDTPARWDLEIGGKNWSRVQTE